MTTTEKPLTEAMEGDVFQHEITGAIVVVVENRGRWIERKPFSERWRCDELITVQLNEGIIEGHSQGWVSVLEPDAKGWHYVRRAA